MGARPQLLMLAAVVAAALLLAPAGSAARVALVASTARGAGAERFELDAAALARRLTAGATARVARPASATLTPARLGAELMALRSSRDDDVLVYLAGHGDVRGLLLGQDGERGDERRRLSPTALGRLLARVPHRRLLLVVEACDAGVYASALPPRSALLAAASTGELAYAAGWDARARMWRTNAFSQALRRAGPRLTLTAARAAIAGSVRRSHVVLAARGLDPSRVRLGAFLP